MPCNCCPVSTDPLAPFVNTASAAGRYNCSDMCFGDVTAVSDSVTVDVLDVTLTKTVSALCAAPGGTVTYTITLRNHSSLPLTDVLVTDPEIESLLDVGAVYVNGIVVPNADLAKGIAIPAVGAGSCAAITFEATVPADTTGLITNVASACFRITTLCCTEVLTVTSSEAVLNVVTPALTITKEADRCVVTPEEPAVTFTLTVTNTGTCPVENLVVTDVLPVGLAYVAGTTSINGDDPTDLNPAAGIALGTLDVEESVTVAFQASAEF